jgi:hydroxymethylpyrimidine/phosphomethylpyrimidine kinase / thiaminase
LLIRRTDIQLLAVLEDTQVKAMKTGMLYDAATITAVVNTIKRFYTDGAPPIVCDPVCVSTSGHPLLREDALDTLIDMLFPLTYLLTPNTVEAVTLLRRYRRKDSDELSISNLEDMLKAATLLLDLGPDAVLLKGGHTLVTEPELRRMLDAHPDDSIAVIKDGGLLHANMEILDIRDLKETTPETPQWVVDVLCQRSSARKLLFVRPRIESTSTHGTGCTLSAAVAALLAKGIPCEYTQCLSP